jgi:hypothetical protein
MDEGRRHMWKQHLSVARDNAAARAAAVQDARRAAARAFWCHLDDFVAALPRAQREWRGVADVPEDHPFIALASVMPPRYKLVWPEHAAVGPQPEFHQPPA